MGHLHPHTGCHCPIQCILPPHMLDAIKLRGTEKQRKQAMALEKQSLKFREERETAVPAGGFQVARVHAAGQPPGPNRKVYDGESKAALPGKLVRSEGDPATGDRETDEAYEGSGDTYRLYADLFGRDSIDGNGMELLRR